MKDQQRGWRRVAVVMARIARSAAPFWRDDRGAVLNIYAFADNILFVCLILLIMHSQGYRLTAGSVLRSGFRVPSTIVSLSCKPIAARDSKYKPCAGVSFPKLWIFLSVRAPARSMYGSMFVITPHSPQHDRSCTLTSRESSILSVLCPPPPEQQP